MLSTSQIHLTGPLIVNKLSNIVSIAAVAIVIVENALSLSPAVYLCTYVRTFSTLYVCSSGLSYKQCLCTVTIIMLAE